MVVKKVFSFGVISTLILLCLISCHFFTGLEPYQEQNVNGFRAVELKSTQLDGNLNRLSFGVSSRKVTDATLAGTSIKPWGCVIQDSATGDIAEDPVAGRRIVITAINETNNAGKIAGSEDGIAFYFKEVDKDTNFRISADFYIDNYGFTRGRPDLNGQEAFGFMARDYVPQHEDNGGGINLTMEALKNKAWNDVYWNGYNTTLDDGVAGSSNMIMVGGVKRGARVYWRTGVTDPGGKKEPVTDPSAVADASFAKFAFEPKELIDYSVYGTGPDGIRSRPDFPTAGLTYKLYLEKTNSGFIARIEPPAGVGKGVTKSRTPKDGEILEWTDRELAFPDMLFSIEKEKYYVGFFAARDARVTITNIRYEESPASLCPPRVDPEPEALVPTFSVQSPTAMSVPDYTLYARSNVEGLMSVKRNGGEPLVYEGAWITEPSNASAEPLCLFTIPGITLSSGDNVFDMVFYPDAKQERSGYMNTKGEKLMTSTTPIYQTFMVNLRSLNTPDGNIWVAPNGRSSGAGTQEDPMDIHTAISIVSPGQTIMLKDGIYTPVEPPIMIDGVSRVPIRLTIPRFNSGRPNPDAVLDPNNPTITERNPHTNPDYYKYYKKLQAQNRDKAIFDFRKDLVFQGYYPRAFELHGDYWWFDGIHVRNAYTDQKGLTVFGSHNLFTWVKTYFNGDSGLQIAGRNSEPKSMWPSYNSVMYCESFGNADDSLTNADGFASKLTSGPGNYFYRNIAHNNVDDGWDLFAKKETGPIGELLIQECVAYANGRYLNDEMARNYPSNPGVKELDSTNAGGNGFKMGGEGIPVLHHAIDCLSFWNDGDGFTSNSDPAIRLTHCTSVDNYNRIDSNPGSNFAIYSASSASYEGLDAIITQVFSWYTTGRGIRGHRGDRLEPKSPSAGYVWRNYVLSQNVPGAPSTPAPPNNTSVSYGTLNTAKDDTTGEIIKLYDGKSVSTQYILRKWSSNAGDMANVDYYTNLTLLAGWNKYIDGRLMTQNDFYNLVGWYNDTAVPALEGERKNSSLNPPFFQIGGQNVSPWEPVNGDSHIEGNFFEVYQEKDDIQPGSALYGLPKWGDFMRLDSLKLGGVTPGARGLWQ